MHLLFEALLQSRPKISILLLYDPSFKIVWQFNIQQVPGMM